MFSLEQNIILIQIVDTTFPPIDVTLLPTKNLIKLCILTLFCWYIELFINYNLGVGNLVIAIHNTMIALSLVFLAPRPAAKSEGRG